VRHLTAADFRFVDISITAHAGEVVGIYGLVGSGRSEFAQAVFGLRPCGGGTIVVDGRPRDIRAARQAVSSGLAYLPEDRLLQGVFRGLSVRANMVLASLRALVAGPLASASRERSATRHEVESLGIRCRDVEQPLVELSGGNQQKVVLGRWLLTRPAVLLLDEPTRGIDVASKAEIHRILRELAVGGMAIVMISSELEEVLEHSDRILVFRAGRVAAEFTSAEATSEKVAAAALPDSTIQRPANGVRAARPGRPFSIRGEAAVLLAVAALALTLALSTDTFLSGDNLGRLLASAAMWCILSLGAAAIIMAGGIDISAGSLLALSAGVGGLVLKLPYPVGVTMPLAIVAALATGAAGGLCNAALSLAGRVHPIVVTLGTMTIYRGLLIGLSGGETIGGLPPAFVAWSNRQILGMNGSTAVGGAAVVAVYVWLARLRSGRHLVALGSSPAAARLVGISRWRVWLAAFGAGGLLAALAGLVELSQTGSMQSGMGAGYELQAIAAAVIGGVSITGGRGSVIGVCLGALLLSLIYNALVLWQISGYHYALVTGLMLLAAVLADLGWRRIQR
jgi:ribose/xylose/arabinose/galactoside ABC-type transport system permease subunit/ABC-type multidrug transport system ATPase subunit